METFQQVQELGEYQLKYCLKCCRQLDFISHQLRKGYWSESEVNHVNNLLLKFELSGLQIWSETSWLGFGHILCFFMSESSSSKIFLA